MNIIIGLVAKPGAGKGTFPKLLREACAKNMYFPSIGGPRFSDALRETLNYYEILPSRENLQELAKWLDARKPGAVTLGMQKKLETDKNEIKIADGVRWHYDEEMIRRLPNGLMVYIKTDPKIRYERIKARNEKSGDAEKTIEKFIEEDDAQTERFIDDIGSLADFAITNDGSLEDYRKQVEDFYEKFIVPLRNSNPLI